MNFLLETLLGVLVTSAPVQEKIEPARTAIIQSISIQPVQSSNKESEKANEPSNPASSPSKK